MYTVYENIQEAHRREASNVYFTSFKATERENLLQKLHRLMKTVGFETIDFTDKYTLTATLYMSAVVKMPLITLRQLMSTDFPLTRPDAMSSSVTA